MKYIKVVLTIIAVLLALNMVKPMIVRDVRAADTRLIRVDIVKIAGQSLYKRAIPVE